MLTSGASALVFLSLLSLRQDELFIIRQQDKPGLSCIARPYSGDLHINLRTGWGRAALHALLEPRRANRKTASLISGTQTTATGRPRVLPRQSNIRAATCPPGAAITAHFSITLHVSTSTRATLPGTLEAPAQILYVAVAVPHTLAAVASSRCYSLSRSAVVSTTTPNALPRYAPHVHLTSTTPLALIPAISHTTPDRLFRCAVRRRIARYFTIAAALVRCRLPTLGPSSLPVHDSATRCDCA